MRYLVIFLRIFLTAFGLSVPKPREERRMALFLFGTLAALALMIFGATWILLGMAR